MKEQIKEMANDIAKICPDLVENCCGQINCVTHLALSLYDADYRKQSEWISVTERLPESGASVLGYSEIVGDIRCYDICKGRCDSILQWWSETGWATVDDLLVTHWMPLPKPPEMKGGE